MTTSFRKRRAVAKWIAFLGIVLISPTANPQIKHDSSEVTLTHALDEGKRSDALHSLDARLGHKVDHVNTETNDREFREHVAEFANAWNALMQDGEKGLWNPKHAHQTRKAFERLIHSKGWVEISKN
jgi:hypothetical protein